MTNTDNDWLQSIIDEWSHLRIIGEPREFSEHRREYLFNHLQRCLYTVSLIPEARKGQTLLELGAAPYLMTLFLQNLRQYHLELVNYFEQPAGSYSTPIMDMRSRKSLWLPYRQFNVEQDPFPYRSNSFDVVLCCELIEHLLVDPVQMLSEIHRVLKKDGLLVMTTPNVLRNDNLVSLLKGENIYQKYSGFGLHGGHHHEYTPMEMKVLLEATGFHIDLLETRDLHPVEKGFRRKLFGLGVGCLGALQRLLCGWPSPPRKFRHLYIVVTARPNEVYRFAYPPLLFADRYGKAFIKSLLGASVANEMVPEPPVKLPATQNGDKVE